MKKEICFGGMTGIDR